MMDQALFEYLCGFLTQERLDKFDRILEHRTRHVTVVLEDIFHPPNAGAVIRSCECFGLQDMYIIENEKPFRVNADVVKGAAKWVDLHMFSEGARSSELCIAELKAKGYKIAATTLRESCELITPEQIPVEDKIALFMGAEETGLSDYVHEQADYFVHIPMCGFTQSFNISVSAAICLRAMVNNLQQSELQWYLSDEEKFQVKADWVWKSVKHAEQLRERFYQDCINKE